VNELQAEPIGPVPGQERITVIDCLRGWALLGILIANMRGFNAPLAAYFQPYLLWTWGPDRAAQALVDWLVQGKFITIFATLFGVGFAIQMDRAMARQQGVGFYARRMIVLLAIGLVHGLVIWWGDILSNYAVCGLLLFFFRKRSQKTVMIWAQIMYWFLPVLLVGFYIASLFGVSPPQQPEPNLQEAIRMYGHGTIRDVFVIRAREWVEANGFILVLTRVLGIILFGVFIWRQGYLQRPDEHETFWKRAQMIGLPVGILGNLACVAIEMVFHPNPMRPSIWMVIYFVLQSLVVPALSLGYSATLVRLWMSPAWRPRLMPFSYVGRMALTNYLMQSVICTTIFYSYGLGLYGRVGPLIDLPLAIAIYALQVPFSKWWLASHQYGPMEWVWRRLTYGRLDGRLEATGTSSAV
jgi:uncharacterized protein